MTDAERSDRPVILRDEGPASSGVEPDDSWLRDPTKIRQALRDLAREVISYAASLAAQHELRTLVGNVDVMPKGSHGKTLTEIQDLVGRRAGEEIDRVRAALNPSHVAVVVERSSATSKPPSSATTRPGRRSCQGDRS